MFQKLKLNWSSSTSSQPTEPSYQHYAYAIASICHKHTGIHIRRRSISPSSRCFWQTWRSYRAVGRDNDCLQLAGARIKMNFYSQISHVTFGRVWLAAVRRISSHWTMTTCCRNLTHTLAHVYGIRIGQFKHHKRRWFVPYHLFQAHNQTIKYRPWPILSGTQDFHRPVSQFSSNYWLLS